MPAEIEGETNATELGDLVRAGEITLLVSPPTVNEEDARQLRTDGDKRPRDRLAIDINRRRFIERCHTNSPERSA